MIQVFNFVLAESTSFTEVQILLVLETLINVVSQVSTVSTTKFK